MGFFNDLFDSTPTRSEELQQHHNDGQESKEYDQPHDFLDSMFAPWADEDFKEDNDAYDKGWDNAHKK